MTRWALRTLAAATCAVIATAVVAAQKVSFDYDKKADFGAFKTFAFKAGTPSDNPLVDDQIQSSVAATLASRGMTGVDESPDVYVVTHLTVATQKDTAGTLVIDVVDAANGAVVWHGTGATELKPQPKTSPVDQNVNEAVTRVLRNYPPSRAKPK